MCRLSNWYADCKKWCCLQVIFGLTPNLGESLKFDSIFKTLQLRFLNIHSAATSFTKFCFYWSLKTTCHGLVAFSILELPVNTDGQLLGPSSVAHRRNRAVMFPFPSPLYVKGWWVWFDAQPLHNHHWTCIQDLDCQLLLEKVRLLLTLASMTMAHITVKGSNDQGRAVGGNIEMFFH